MLLYSQQVDKIEINMTQTLIPTGEFDRDRIIAAIQLVASGESSIRNTLKELQITAYRFYEIIANDPQISDAYARAQLSRADILAEEILTIADTEHDPQKARNRIDARKWFASKMQPHKYGDRLDINMNSTVDVRGALTDARQRAALPGRYQQPIEDAQVVELPKLYNDCVTGSQPVEPKTRDASELSEEEIFS